MFVIYKKDNKSFFQITLRKKNQEEQIKKDNRTKLLKEEKVPNEIKIREL
jgi:hypothetical protein